jgi:predicted O-methyltransferase YrrM
MNENRQEKNTLGASVDTPVRRYTHGELIGLLLDRDRGRLPEKPVFIETGCGISTLLLADAGRALGAKIYSCDFNVEKVRALQQRAGERVSNIEFLAGDSVALLQQLAQKHEQIDFLFLDAAASAMHTFREFQVVEQALKSGSVLLIDNAALPGETRLLSPCRKGKIIVPYLQASSHWEVFGHPDAGDSMISAVCHDRPDFADPDYEWPEYIDPWEWSFENQWVESDGT